jgi:flagellar basal body-associated protein FliL
MNKIKKIIIVIIILAAVVGAFIMGVKSGEDKIVKSAELVQTDEAGYEIYYGAIDEQHSYTFAAESEGK